MTSHIVPRYSDLLYIKIACFQLFQRNAYLCFHNEVLPKCISENAWVNGIHSFMRFHIVTPIVKKEFSSNYDMRANNIVKQNVWFILLASYTPIELRGALDNHKEYANLDTYKSWQNLCNWIGMAIVTLRCSFLSSSVNRELTW